jgi:hypothetical protein
MKATIISSIAELPTVKTKAVILGFRPSMSDILKISAAGIKTIQVNQSANKTLSKSFYTLAEQMKIKIQVANVQGIRRDKNGDVVEIGVSK